MSFNDSIQLDRCSTPGCSGKLLVIDSFTLPTGAERRKVPDHPVLRECNENTRYRLRECRLCERRVWSIEVAVLVEDRT